MGMGRRAKEWQEELFVTTDRLPRGEGHAFYEKLGALLVEEGFDEAVETLCEPYYASEEKRGRPSIPPGTYFRMLMVGFFEGIGSQRGIAWRCSDSLSVRKFLGVPLTGDTPDHSSLTRLRDRLPLEVHQRVFELVLSIAARRGLLKGKTIAIDSTTLEANAAMRGIVRKGTGEDWRAYVVGLMKQEGVIGEADEPTDEEVRRFDKKRKNKKVSNQEWESPSDPDSRIARMKDGRTHLAYKAEHAVDLQTELILAAEVYHADHSDSQTLCDTAMAAQTHLSEAGREEQIEQVVADKGYHAAGQLELATGLHLRTYVPEPQRNHLWSWTDKPVELKEAVYANRRRTKTEKNSRLQRLRSERVERSFAHVCETGGARRSWLRGIEKVRKRLLMTAAARNLGLVMRRLFGIGKPRVLQGAFAPLLALLLAIFARLLYASRRKWGVTSTGC
jgi:transposase